MLSSIRRALRRIHASYGHRTRAVGIAVAATVQHGRLVQSATLGWRAVELATLAVDAHLPLVIDNDATLAGVAESRHGAARGAGTALHVTVEVGVGGVLVVDGLPVRGATGAGGEFGHVPFGDRRLRCPCGARGCWDLTVDGRALARHLGAAAPPDPRAYATDVLARCGRDSEARAAVNRVGKDLATGLAGLVNALDPEVVTLGGLAEPLRAAAGPHFTDALTGGLMAFRRPNPPPVLAAELGDEGALHGAAASALDTVLSEDGLDAWVAKR